MAVDAAAIYRGRSPGGQIRRHFPDGSPCLGIQAKNLRQRMRATAARAREQPFAHDDRVGIDMDPPPELPACLPRCGVKSVDAVVPGAKENFPIGDTGARLDVPGRLEMPK